MQLLHSCCESGQNRVVPFLFGSLLLCGFVGFAIVGLLSGSYSSVLRVRPDVGVPVVLLLPGCCAASFLVLVQEKPQLLNLTSEWTITGCWDICVRQFAVVQIRRVSIIVGLLGGSYSSLLRLRPGVRISVLLLELDVLRRYGN